MTIFADLMKGGAEGLLKGVGSFAKDVRAAITGKDPLTAEQRTQLEMQAMALEEAALVADQKVIEGQLAINKAEAESDSFFRGGWRPAVGWVCVSALVYTYILKPILPWFLDTIGLQVQQMPDLDMKELFGLLAALLGLGGFRTFEKVKGLK